MLNDELSKELQPEILERKLASVQEVLDVQPIPEADRIEAAKVEGWTVVVPKGQVKPGDKVVYFEIDSFLPIRPEFEFLRDSSYKKDDFLGEGMRLKTRRLRGIYSQGLIMPLSDLGLPENLEVDTDLTEILGVKKYELPETALIGGASLGRRPDFIVKTNEIRVQNKPQLLNELGRCEEVYVSLKLDGSSHSVAIDRDGKLRVTSHNIELKDENKQNSFYEFVKNNNIEEKLRKYMAENDLNEAVLQGEWCGPGIQNNKLMLKTPDWFMFNVYGDGRRQDLDTLLKVSEEFNLKHVPILERLTGKEFSEKFSTPDDILQWVENLKVDDYKNQLPEGVVIRPTEPIYSYTIQSDLSMKVINNKYLMKE